MLDDRKKQTLRQEYALRAHLQEALPLKDLPLRLRGADQGQTEALFLPSFALAHTRAVLQQGQFYSLPRTAVEGPNSAITDLQETLTTAAFRPLTEELEVPSDLDMAIQIDTTTSDMKVLNMPEGKSVFSR